MSIKAMSLVWDHSTQKGSSLILLLAIADYANEDNRAWPSIGTLAAKIRMSERNTQILMRKIMDAGELEMQQNACPNGTNVYRITLGKGGENFTPLGGENFAPGGAKPSTEGVKNSAQGGAIAIAPEPSLDPSVEPSVREGAGTAQPAAAEPPTWYEADQPAPTPPSVRSLTQQPPIAMYRDAFLRYPSKPQMALIMAHGVDDLRRWRAVLALWCGRGWTVTNVSGMLDLYDHPERLEDRQRPPAAAHRPTPHAPATPGADPAWQQSWDEWIAELSKPAGLGDSAMTVTAPIYSIPREQFWAQGCDHCRYGIQHPIPALRNDRPLYQERLAQFNAGELRPCNCAAGAVLADWLGVSSQNEQQYQDNLAAMPTKLAGRRNDQIFANAGIPAKYAAYTLSGFEQLAGGAPASARPSRPCATTSSTATPCRTVKSVRGFCCGDRRGPGKPAASARFSRSLCAVAHPACGCSTTNSWPTCANSRMARSMPAWKPASPCAISSSMT